MTPHMARRVWKHVRTDTMTIDNDDTDDDAQTENNPDGREGAAFELPEDAVFESDSEVKRKRVKRTFQRVVRLPEIIVHWKDDGADRTTFPPSRIERTGRELEIERPIGAVLQGNVPEASELIVVYDTLAVVPESVVERIETGESEVFKFEKEESEWTTEKL